MQPYMFEMNREMAIVREKEDNFKKTHVPKLVYDPKKEKALAAEYNNKHLDEENVMNSILDGTFKQKTFETMYKHFMEYFIKHKAKVTIPAAVEERIVR